MAQTLVARSIFFFMKMILKDDIWDQKHVYISSTSKDKYHELSIEI